LSQQLSAVVYLGREGLGFDPAHKALRGISARTAVCASPVPLIFSPHLLPCIAIQPEASGFRTLTLGEGVATPQAARGWAHPPCRRFKIQSCCCLGSAFQTLTRNSAVCSDSFRLSESHEQHDPRWRDAMRRALAVWDFSPAHVACWQAEGLLSAFVPLWSTLASSSFPAVGAPHPCYPLPLSRPTAAPPTAQTLPPSSSLAHQLLACRGPAGRARGGGGGAVRRAAVRLHEPEARGTGRHAACRRVGASPSAFPGGWERE
jgi:hypothetical protein